VWFRWDSLGELIEPALEDIGVHAIEDHGKTLTGDRSHRSDDVGPNVVPRRDKREESGGCDFTINSGELERSTLIM